MSLEEEGQALNDADDKFKAGIQVYVAQGYDKEEIMQAFDDVWEDMAANGGE